MSSTWPAALTRVPPCASTEDDNATVVAGDDQLGGWFGGVLVPEATVSDAAFVRRSQLSGEWAATPSDQWFASRGVEPGAGLELTGLALCVTGRAALHTTYKGHPVTVHRLSVDEMEARDRRLRAELRTLLDEHAHEPVVAVDVLRRWLDDEDRDETAAARRRVAALPVSRLPTQRVDEPLASSIRDRSNP